MYVQRKGDNLYIVYYWALNGARNRSAIFGCGGNGVLVPILSPPHEAPPLKECARASICQQNFKGQTEGVFCFKICKFKYKKLDITVTFAQSSETVL